MKSITKSVIICTKNRLSDVLIFLESLLKQTSMPEELIIVDSSNIPISSENSFNALFNPINFSQTTLIYNHSKPGLPYQRNVGISLATKEIIYFFDDDVILEPEYLELMDAVFANQPHYAGGMGTVTNISPKKPIFNFGKAFFFLQRDYSSGTFTASGIPTHPYGKEKFMDVEVLGGCCMAFRASVFLEHKFDESLGGYAFMEDCDFSRRVSYQLPLFFNPQAKLQHMVSPMARDRVVDNRAMYIKNYSYLFFKNFYPKNRLAIVAYWWSIVGLFVEASALRRKEYIKGYAKGLKQYYRG